MSADRLPAPPRFTAWPAARRVTCTTPDGDGTRDGRGAETQARLEALTRSALELIAVLRVADKVDTALVQAVRRYVADAAQANVPPSHIRLALELLVHEHVPVPTRPARRTPGEGTPSGHPGARQRLLRPVVDAVWRVAGLADARREPW